MACSAVRTIAGLVLAIQASLLVAGCAADPRYRQGVSWVEEQNAERARLQAAGFPQFSGAM